MNATEISSERTAPRGNHRILYVSDPSSIARNFLPDPVREEDLRRWVDMVADSGVDLFDQEVFSQGWTTYWQSERYEYDRRLQHRRFLPLLEAGTQPLDILIDQAHRREMKFIAGFRVNDNHAHQSREQGVGIAEFIESRPDLQLKELPEGEYYEMSEPLDFSFEEVREFTLGVVREVVARFDIDGVELCFRDHAYFPRDRGLELASLMTDLVQQIRAVLDERGAAIGGKLVLGARVYSTIEECAFLGLDVPTWISDGLIDYISPQDVMYADFSVPYDAWAALARDSDCLLYPGLQPWSSFRARYRRNGSPLSPASVRALAQTMYGAGADGIAIYNHFVANLWYAPFYPQAMQIFHQLRDPARIARGERHYIFDPTWAGMTGFGGEAKCSTGTVKANQILLDPSHDRGEYRFYLFEDLQNVRSATLFFRGFGLSQDDELEVRLNGHLVPAAAIGRTGQSDALPGDRGHVREEGERIVPCIPERGRVDCREDSGPAFSTRWFSLSATMVAYGENCLSIALLQRDPQAEEDIVIDELEVWVEPWWE